MSTCDECGDELQNRDKDTAGHYRDKCIGCVTRLAESIPPHHETCSVSDCPVCDHYARD